MLSGLSPLEFGRAECETDDLRQTLEIYGATEAGNLRPRTARESFPVRLRLLLSATPPAATSPTKAPRHRRAIGHRVRVGRGQHGVFAAHENLPRLG